MDASYAAWEDLLCLSTKRELIDIGTDKRYIRRDEKGQYTEDQFDVGRSLAADRRQQSKTPAKAGQGDRGDHRTES